MKKIITALITMFAVLMLPVSVSAATPAISIPISTIVRGDVGSVHELETATVDNQYVGLTCDVTAVAINQGSVHPNNDLTVASDGNSVTLKDVERESNGTTTAESKLLLGNNLTVSLTLGEDGVFSGGMNVEVNCEQPPKDIEVCRDGKVITIKENERKETDTDAPCPVEPKDINVCRDGKVITIKENERKETDTDAPCPKVLTKKTTLPNTGSGSLIGILTITTVAGTLAHRAFTKRNLS